MARILPVDQIGVLAIASLISFGLEFATAPIDSDSVLKFVAENRAMGRLREASAVFYQAIVTNVAVSTSVMFVILFLVGTFSLSIPGSAQGTFLLQLVALDLPLQFGLFPILIGATSGMQRFSTLAAVGVLRTAVRQIIAIVLLIRWEPSAVSVVASWFLADMVICAVLLFFTVRRMGAVSFEFSIRKLLSYSLPLRLSELGAYSYDWFDLFILANLVALSTLGVYEVVMITFTMVALIPRLISDALFPTYVELKTLQGQIALGKATRTASRYSTYTVLPLTIGLIAVSEQFLELIAGPNYTSGAGALRILTAFLAVTFMFTALSRILMTTGETSKLSGLTIAGFLAGSILAVILVPFLGIIGAAVARGVAMCLTFGLLLIVLRGRVNVQFDKEAILKGSFASLGMAICVFPIAWLLRSPLLLPIPILAGCVSYLLLLRGLDAIHNRDLVLVEVILGHRFRRAFDWLERRSGA